MHVVLYAGLRQCNIVSKSKSCLNKINIQEEHVILDNMNVHSLN